GGPSGVCALAAAGNERAASTRARDAATTVGRRVGVTADLDPRGTDPSGPSWRLRGARSRASCMESAREITSRWLLERSGSIVWMRRSRLRVAPYPPPGPAPAPGTGVKVRDGREARRVARS